MDISYLDRIANTEQAFEGGGILPPPKQGRRLQSPTNLRILRNESVVGGAKLTIGWIDDGAAVNNNSSFEINVYSGRNFGLFSTAQNLNSTEISKLTPLQTLSKITKSPIELFVPAAVATPVTITVTLRHSSGIVSLESFASATTAFIRPLGSYVLRTVATSFTMSKTRGQILLADTTAGNLTVTLPPISEVIDGFEQTVFKIDSSANTITITPGASATINGAATAVILAQYGSVTYFSERANNKWWIKSRTV